MEVKDAINLRRAYRSLEHIDITDKLIDDFAIHAQLAPSCFNNQPTRFVFVYAPDILTKIHEALTKGNAWAKAASLIIVVVGKKDFGCVVEEREYFLFDLGLASAFLLLRATELGLVAHPIAGFDEDKVKEILEIPYEMTVITLINVGKKSNVLNPVLSEKQIKAEKVRPERKPLKEFVFRNKYGTS